jgi:hypothetical protein
MNKLNKMLSEGFASIDEITADACYQLDCIVDDSLNKDSISPLLDLMKQSHDRKAEANSILIFEGLERDFQRRQMQNMGMRSQYTGAQYTCVQNMRAGGLGSMVGNSFVGSLWQ